MKLVKVVKLNNNTLRLLIDLIIKFIPDDSTVVMNDSSKNKKIIITDINHRVKIKDSIM